MRRGAVFIPFVLLVACPRRETVARDEATTAASSTTSASSVASSAAASVAPTVAASGSASAAPSSGLVIGGLGGPNDDPFSPLALGLDGGMVPGLKSPTKPDTLVVKLAVQSKGKLPQEIVLKSVRTNLGRFRACYAQGLKFDPMLAGTVITTFRIDATGAVEAVTDAGGTLTHKPTRVCVIGVHRTLGFPEPQAGTVDVTSTLTFAPKP